MTDVWVAPRLEPLHVGSQYDVVIAVTGYEQRARFFSSTYQPSAGHKLAPSFTERTNVLAWRENLKFFSNAGYMTDVLEDDAFAHLLRNILLECARGQVEPLRVCVDVSSMTRVRIALVLEALVEGASFRSISADFFYSPAKFLEPGESSIITHFGPVSDFFVGSGTPASPMTLVLGIGFEAERALGVVETLEPDDLLVFTTVGSDPRFSSSVGKLNSLLLEDVAAQKIVSYPIGDAFESFILLHSAVASSVCKSRVMLVPLGPKIFALNAMLVAASLGTTVGVWRVSGGHAEAPRDAIADGTLASLNVSFSHIELE